MDNDPGALLKKLPGVDTLLQQEAIAALLKDHSRAIILDVIRESLEELRQDIQNDRISQQQLELSTLTDEIMRRCRKALRPSLRRAVNGAGIVLHTGLGRAPYCAQAREALREATEHYCALQVDLATGKRGDRYEHVEKLLCRITGAEAALVVNNNAAATMLILNTLADGKEVIVSRGELVEIGGSFRIPDVMSRSGATLAEVGASNRTHLKDYSGAITEETALLLKVHQSNFRIIGFTKQVSIAELADLAHKHGLLAVDDLGSGALVDLSRWGVPKEPMAQESIKSGADVVCFSGDKLLGGPQCGIIVGKREPVEQMKKNQLVRALRCDKMTFAVLEATLRLFLDEERLLLDHPVLRMLTEPLDAVKKRAAALARGLRRIDHSHLTAEIIQDMSEAGSGSLAGYKLPTWGIALHVEGKSAAELAACLRLGEPPVLGRIQEEVFLLDCRTIRKDEFSLIRIAVENLISKSDGNKDD